MQQRRCEHRKDDGQQCGGWATNGSRFCFAHDPTKTKQRQEASAQGGRNRRRPLRPQQDGVKPPTTPAELLDSLGEVYVGVRQGDIDPKVGNCLAIIAGKIRDAFEAAELVERVKRLEHHLEAQKG